MIQLKSLQQRISIFLILPVAFLLILMDLRDLFMPAISCCPSGGRRPS